MNIPTRERWRQLWRETNARSEPAGWFDQLIAAWTEPQRHYHNLTHLAECFAEFDPVRTLAAHPAAVEFALWFHDAVYDPKASDNEERSAALAIQCLSEAGLPRDFSNGVVQLILATKHHEAGAHPDAPLLIDVDLSILGQPEPRFREYEEQIRREYAWVPDFVFAGKRAKILERFVARDRVYHTDWFNLKFEAQARANLQWSIQKLRS